MPADNCAGPCRIICAPKCLNICCQWWWSFSVWSRNLSTNKKRNAKKSLPKQLLSVKEQAKCRKLAEVFVEQMWDNAGKICGKDKGICFSPCILWMALSVYVHSSVRYEELKKSLFEIFPSCSTIARMKWKWVQKMASVLTFISGFLMKRSDTFLLKNILDNWCVMRCTWKQVYMGTQKATVLLDLQVSQQSWIWLKKSNC